jgi:hypothetical protein
MKKLGLIQIVNADITTLPVDAIVMPGVDDLI